MVSSIHYLVQTTESMQIRNRCLWVHCCHERASLIFLAACVCVLLHNMFASLCVCFILGPANLRRNPSSNFLLNEHKLSMKIKVIISVVQLVITQWDTICGRRARRIPVLSYRTTAWFLINVIQCHTCRGNSPSDRMNPQGLDNRGHYHPFLQGDISAWQ